MLRSMRGCAVLGVLCLLAACTTDPFTGERQLSKTAAGAMIGTAAGAAGGAAIGAIAGGGRGAAKGAMIGAGVGVLSGGAVGAYMDIQESKLREQLRGTGVSVTRVGDELVLNMPGNLTFDTNQSAIRPSFYAALNSVTLVLKEYPKTIIEVSGHTDSTGSDALNQTLSDNRAMSVASYLTAQGVDQRRVLAQGFGKRSPIADNATVDGRQANRRVELRLVPITA